MGHQSEHMEVVAQFTWCHKQGTSGVKRHIGHGLVSVGVEMFYKSISFIVFIHIELKTKNVMNRYKKALKIFQILNKKYSSWHYHFPFSKIFKFQYYIADVDQIF